MNLRLDIQSVQRMLAEGKVSAESLVDEALARQPEFLFATPLDADARQAAEISDAARAAGDSRPLLGVPITIKDNFAVAGHLTTAGSVTLRNDAPATADAQVVTRLKAAGMVILGRTNMTEFAFSGLGVNPHYGTPANPLSPDEIVLPGGSSSGAAVSVAAGLCPVAIGTDTGGSARIPAAWCRLVGFKPTADAISVDGVLPLSTTLDGVGILANCVDDIAQVFAALRLAPSAPAQPLHERQRIGLIENYVFDDADPVVLEAINTATERLQASGIDVVRVKLPALAGIAGAMAGGTFAGAEAYAWHAERLAAGLGKQYDPRVLSRIEAGAAVTSDAYRALLEWRKGFIADYTALAMQFDALAWPTTPILPPRLSDMADDAAYWRANGLSLRNSTIANLGDGCAISLPCPGKAPVGLTFASSRDTDDALLAFARRAQMALNS